MVPRLSSIGRQAALQAAAALASAASSSLEPISALRRRLDQEHRRRDGPETDASGGAGSIFNRQADAAPHDGDVHLGARDHAQVGVARALRTRRQGKGNDDLAGLEVETARPLRHLLDGKLAATVRSWMVTMAPAATMAGTLSPAGEPLHRLPPGVARPWIWVEPIRLVASTTPGQTLLTLACSRSAAPETAAPIRKPPSFVSSMVVSSPIFLTSTMVPRRHDPVAHLDQQVGPAGQDPTGPRRRGKRPNRLVERLRRYVLDIHRSTLSSRRRLRRSSLFRLSWNEA